MRCMRIKGSPFGRGLSPKDGADLWLRDATGVIDLWINVGLPDERDIRKACGRSRQVVVLAYGERRLAAVVGRLRACAGKARQPLCTQCVGRRRLFTGSIGGTNDEPKLHHPRLPSVVQHAGDNSGDHAGHFAG